MNYKNLSKSIIVLITFVIGILFTSIYANSQSINDVEKILKATSSSQVIQSSAINEKEIRANEDDFVFFPFEDYTLIFSEATEPNDGWYLLENDENTIFKTSIDSDFTPNNYVSRHENYIHFKKNSLDYFYDIEDNDFNLSENNWRHNYSVIDASYTTSGEIIGLPIWSLPDKSYLQFYIANHFIDDPDDETKYAFDEPLYKSSPIKIYKQYDELFNTINFNDDFIIVEVIDSKLFGTDGFYTYINLNQAIKQDSNGNDIQNSNNGSVIKFNNQVISNNDDNDSFFKSLTPITKNWINSSKKHRFYYYDNANDYVRADSVINYDSFYGQFNAGYQIYKKDNQYNIVHMLDGYSDLYDSKPYEKRKITNLDDNIIIDYVQTPDGDFYLTETTSNYDMRNIRFVDSSKLLNDSNGDWNNNSAIVGQYKDHTSEYKLLYATDFVFYYLQGGVLKSDFLPWIDLVDYEGSSILIGDDLFFDNNIKFALSKNIIKEVEFSRPINKETTIVINEDEEYYYIEITTPDFSSESLDLNISFNSSNLRFRFPRILIYKHYRPPIQFSGSDLSKYVTKNNNLKSEDDELFSNIVTSTEIIHLKIDDKLVKKISLNFSEWDVINGEFDSEKEPDYIGEDGFNSKPGSMNELTIYDVFGNEWKYTLVVENTDSEHIIENYFETDEGNKLLEITTINGIDLPNNPNTLNSEQVEALYNHALNITDLGLIDNYDETIQNNLGESLVSNWYNLHQDEKLPLNRLSLSSKNIDNTETLKEAMEKSVIKTINSDYLNSVTSKNLTTDDIEASMDTPYLNWNSIITVSSVSKQNAINGFNLKLDKRFFNYYDISSWDYVDGIKYEVEKNYQKLVDDKELKKGMTWEESNALINDAIIDSLNGYNKPWTQGKSPSRNYSILASDIEITYEYHEKDIPDDQILNDIEYFRINISSSDENTSIVYSGDSSLEFVIDNSLFETAGFLFYYQELIFALILLMLLLILIIGTLFLIPWVRHSKRLKQMKKNQNK